MQRSQSRYMATFSFYAITTQNKWLKRAKFHSTIDIIHLPRWRESLGNGLSIGMGYLQNHIQRAYEVTFFNFCNLKYKLSRIETPHRKTVFTIIT